MPCRARPDPQSVHTVTDLLRQRAEWQPDQTAFTFLLDGETRTAALTYAALDARAKAIAAVIQERTHAGDRVLVAYESSLEFIAAFFGCLYAGVIAVPVAPPGRRGGHRFRAIAEACGAALCLSHDDRPRRLHPASIAGGDALPTLDTTGCDTAGGLDWRPPVATREATAFLQFTSGSTAHPRGVELTHDNLLQNQSSIRRAFCTGSESSVFGWLPLHHDMGLIGIILHPIFMGIPCVLMSPAHFIERPVRWLRALSQYRTTISGGPNFAYELCIRRTSIEDRASLDLSAWKVAFNGAEPVRPDTLRGFAAAFFVAGFEAKAFHPCYGLAEASLFVAGGAPGTAPVVARFDRTSIASGIAYACEDGHEHSRELIAYDADPVDQQLYIVRADAATRCAAGEIGEIWVAGPNVARGYWNQPGENARIFGARLAEAGNRAFLRTGDLGFIREGHLFITGRSKDLIILRGRNLHPHDIERSVEASNVLLRPGAGAAFSIDVDGVEQLVVVHEVERNYRPDHLDAVVQAVRHAVADEHDVHVHTLVLVTAGGVPKTTSGKVQRGVCKARFVEGSLNEVARSRVLIPDAHDDLPLREVVVPLSGGDRHSEVSTLVQDAVASMLGVPATTVDMSMPPIALGLDSLMSVELQYRLERALGIDMNSDMLLQQSTLAAVVDDACARMAAGGSPRRSPAPAGKEFPLSEGQRALWLMQQLAGGDARSRLSRAIDVHGPLDVSAFINALHRVAKRHPALRTIIGSTDGEPMQWISDDDVDATFLDASRWTHDGVVDWLRQEMSRPVSLERCPLFRARLLRRSDQEHVFVVTVHHAVADFWSVAVILNDLEECYAAARAGRSEQLPPLDVSYRDYVNGQQALLRAERVEALWAYWQSQLQGAPLVLELYGDRPRPAMSTARGATWWCEVAPPLVRELKALAKSHGVTLFSVLLATHQVLLHRLTGQVDFLIGVPVANRRDGPWREVVGYFMNLVVMRADLRGNPSFAELLRRTKSTMTGALANQEFPFSTLVERLRPERDLSRPAVVQYGLALLSDNAFRLDGMAAFAAGAQGARVQLSDLTLALSAVEPSVSEFDLDVTLVESGDGLTARFNYNSDLFDAETIQLLATRWQTLLAAVAARSTAPVGTLPVMTTSERKTISRASCGVRRQILEHATHRVFEAQALNATEAMVADERAECTFQALNARANQLARSLRRLGVGAESRVALCVERSIEMVVSALAVLKAGAAYVPLDPSHPGRRLASIIEDSDAAVLVADHTAEGLFPSYRGHLVRLDSTWKTFAHEDPRDLMHDTHPDQAAYVLYTSGSTGRPNGVVVSHQSLSNLLGSMRRRPGFARTDRMIAVTTLAFDIAGLELFLPLTSGGSLMIAGQDTVTDAARLAAHIDRWNATVMQATPATWQMLIDAGWMGKPDLRVWCGGEALPSELAAQLVTRSAALWNMYGPTETTIWSTTAPTRPGDHAIGLGGPIENTEIHVLDEQGHIVPIGVSGEIYIGGDGLARGYLGRPELTAERFVPDPFSSRPGRRLYRTGDRARLRADGSLESLGRADHQIKRRGYRIELGEIEAAARAHPDVQAAVATYDHVRGDKALVAYVVGKSSSEAAIRTHLAAAVPGYMMPASIVFLSALPLTPNGKVDRKALPPPPAFPVPDLPYRDPQGVERMIVEIWRQVLEIDRVGVTDNFFDLGGHSLLLNRVRAHLERSLAREISVVELFRHPTVAALARYLGDAPVNAPDSWQVTEADRLQVRSDGAARLRLIRQRRGNDPSRG